MIYRYLIGPLVAIVALAIGMIHAAAQSFPPPWDTTASHYGWVHTMSVDGPYSPSDPIFVLSLTIEPAPGAAEVLLPYQISEGLEIALGDQPTNSFPHVLKSWPASMIDAFCTRSGRALTCNTSHT